jgi:hypothetical protein
MALNVQWTRISDKLLKLDFRYIFESTDLDLQTKLRISTKPNFIILSWNSMISALVTQSRQLMNYRIALLISIIDSCLRGHSNHFLLKRHNFTSQNLRNWFAFHIWCLLRIDVEKWFCMNQTQVKYSWP